jgi:hypothetical protein
LDLFLLDADEAEDEELVDADEVSLPLPAQLKTK